MFNKISSTINPLFKNKIVLSTTLFVATFVLFVGVFSVGIYKKGWETGIARSVIQVVPFPAAKVGGSFITYSSYLGEVDTLRDYHKDFKSVDFTTEEGKSKLKEIKTTTLDQLIEEIVIAKEAENLGVAVTQEEFESSFKDLLESNGGEEKIKESLEKYYNNMTLTSFKDQYRKKMLRAKLSEKVDSDESLGAESKKKAEQVLSEVKKGTDFSKLAKKYSEDTSASNGGDLGFFGKGKMVPEFEKAVFSLKKGQVSDVVKTVYGYHIIKVTDTKGKEIRASHILIKTQDFNEWLKAKVTSYKVKKYIKI